VPDQSTRLEWEMIDLDRKHFDLPPHSPRTASVESWICLTT
jgi:hypothetical protein